eukprot:g6405.t1
MNLKSAFRITLGCVILFGLGFHHFGIREVTELWRFIQPGGKLHPASFLEHKGHLVIESLLCFAILYLIWLPRSRPKQEQNQLTDEELKELCEEWSPEPLVPEIDWTDDDRIIDSRIDRIVIINDRQILNMQSTDFLGLLTNDAIGKACNNSIVKYGVGSCGPRAFYGTVDVHLQLEEHIARFMGMQESIVYSFDLATVPSLLPAFASAKDVIVVDECVCYPIQTGCRLSRAQVLTFKHNDVEDLERVLTSIEEKHRQQKRPLNRRYIVVEGIYQDCGDVAPLDRIYELKLKYKYRLVVDESLSFGVLGKTGRGACEYFGLTPGDAEIVTASLSHSLVSIGGFCVGDHEIIGHQRINGHGYIFSASLPPFLAAAADEALTQLECNPGELELLRYKASTLRTNLSQIEALRVIGASDGVEMNSPLIHLQLASELDTSAKQSWKMLKRIEKWMFEERGIAVCVPKYSGLEWKQPCPTIRIAVSVKHTEDDLSSVTDALRCAGLNVDEAIQSVHEAFRLGVNFFDTSPYYGLGKSEQILGEALRVLPRKDIIVATKVGRYGLAEFDFSAARVTASIKNSLKVLDMEYLDLVQCHDIEFTNLDQVRQKTRTVLVPRLQIVNETLPALQKAKAEGLVRYVGITGLPLKIFHSILDRVPPGTVDTVLSYCHHSLLDDTLLTEVPYLKSKGVGVINASALSMGLLSPYGPPDWHPASTEMKEVCKKVNEICQEKNVELAKLGIYHSLQNPSIACTLISMPNIAEVKANVATAQLESLTNQETVCLEEIKRLISPIFNQTWPSGLPENN